MWKISKQWNGPIQIRLGNFELQKVCREVSLKKEGAPNHATNTSDSIDGALCNISQNCSKDIPRTEWMKIFYVQRLRACKMYLQVGSKLE